MHAEPHAVGQVSQYLFPAYAGQVDVIVTQPVSEGLQILSIGGQGIVTKALLKPKGIDKAVDEGLIAGRRRQSRTHASLPLPYCIRGRQQNTQ